MPINRTTILDADMAPRPQAKRSPTTWREPLARGVLAIVLGVVLFAFPVSAAVILALGFGIFVLVDGVFAVIHAARNPHPEAGRWWAMLLRGVLGIVVGVFAVIFPTAAAAALGTLIAIWAILAGALEVAAAFRIRHDVPRETLLVVLGALTIVVGVVLLFAPFLAIVAQIWVFAVYAIAAGIALVTYALRLRARSVPAPLV